MAVICPKCHSENPEAKQFCGDCGTRLGIPETPQISVTKTLETPREALSRGTLFAGRYEIIEALGVGGMGEVYRVEDKKVGQEIALKLIKSEIAANRKTIERFRHELKTARMISHRNVCRMFDLGEDKGTYFNTMEYVAGEDLKSFLRRSKQLALGTAISITKQVCEGLAEAHRLGVVHRDLKPGNIMIDKDGNARIMDFGIARSLEAKGVTGEGMIVGTPEYMSPEQVEGKEVDQRSDIYSLGIILYEMLTGRVPFEGDTPFAIGMKHKSEIPRDPREINTQIPPELGRLVLKCLEKDKTKRYQSANEVHADLDKIEQSLPTTERVAPARKPFTSREITVKFNLKKLAVPLIAVIVLAAAAVFLWQFLPRQEAVKSSIAVISFENQTGDTSYDFLQKAIPNLLITSLEQSKYLQVTTWERMHDLLKQKGKADVEVIDRDLGFELCRMDGVRAIILGSFIKADGMFVTEAKVLDVETKSLLKSASARGEGVRSILERQINDLSREIARGVGLSEGKILAGQRRVSDVTTSSMDAYNSFLKGRDEFERYLFVQSRQSLEQALALDPDFALAHLYLAKIYSRLGNTKESAAALEKAKALSQKLTEKERLYIEADYAQVVEQDPEKQFRVLKEIAKKYPKEKRAYSELSLYYFNKNSIPQIIEVLTKALELDPDYGEALNMMSYAHSAEGNFEKALEYNKKYAALLPGDPNPIDSMAELYFLMGDLDEAVAKYEEALRIRPDFFQSNIRLAQAYALKEDYDQALDSLDRFIASSPASPLRWMGYASKNFYLYWIGRRGQAVSGLLDLQRLAEEPYIRTDVDVLLSAVYYDQGELDLCRKHLESWFDSASRDSSSTRSRSGARFVHNYYLGLIDLKEGRVEAARSRLAELRPLLSELDPSDRRRYSFFIDLFQGEILLAQSSASEAIVFLAKASPPAKVTSVQDIPFNTTFYPQDVLARAYKENEEIDKAIAEYERLTSFDPKAGRLTIIHPLYHFRLAKLYEEKGEKDKAAAQYRRFLEIWKKADAGIPEVEDARKRLAGLRGS